MTVAIDIADATIDTRLIGQASESGRLDRRLRAMLADEVLPAVAAELDGGLDSEAIVCVPELPMELRLSLAEVYSADGARRWSSRLAELISKRIARAENVWRFENRWHFLAVWLRVRLGLERTPGGVFTGLGALELLTPVQAVAEALAQWPEIWRWLAAGRADSPDAMARAIAAHGGESAWRQVLVAALRAHRGNSQVAMAPEWLAPIRGFAGSSASIATTAPSDPRAEHLAGQALRLALATGAELGPAAPRLGLLLALVQRAFPEMPDAAAASDWLAGSRQPLSELATKLRQAAEELLEALAAENDGPEILVALARIVSGHARRESPNPSPTPEDSEPAVPPDSAPVDEPEANDTGRAEEREYASPLAGLALLLPMLAENRIGLAFPSRLRWRALLELAAEGPVDRPEQDLLLMAISGVDHDVESPGEPPPNARASERPNELDLLFVPEPRRADVQAAEPGAPRLAAWLEARFAASLPGLSGSSRAFLCQQFLHRPGRLRIGENRILLELDPLPLAVVLRLAGLVGEDCCRLDWLQRRRFDIRMAEHP